MSRTIGGAGGGLTLDGLKNEFKVRLPPPELSLRYLTELLEVDHFRFFFPPFMRGGRFEGIVIGEGVAIFLLCEGMGVMGGEL